MRAQKVLTTALLIAAVGCTKPEEGSVTRPRPAGDMSGALIPLDTLREKEPGYVLRFDAEGTTLTNFHGLGVSPSVAPGAEGEVRRGSPHAPQFEGFFVVHEALPNKAEQEPARRIYNLPELLDRLAAEGKLPDDTVSVWPLNDTTVQVAVLKPTVLAASFSHGRTVKILNRSKLVLICPYCDSIQLTQASPDGTETSIEVHSNSCIPYTYVPKGSFARLLFGTFYLGTIDTRADCDRLDPGNIRQLPVEPKPSELKLEAWMPQALITQKLRSESIIDTAQRWIKIYPIAGVR